MSRHAAGSTALYLRLSRDDGVAGTESESIASQRQILMNFANMHGLSVVAEFCDDGISGTRSDRAGFKAMLSGIEEGWIQTVLVKDLSRLSRDYIRTGELIERWFPAHGARLIAVNDGIDTGVRSAANDYSPIRAVMDDWYARDISRKVRSAIYARQSAGFCTAARLPFGYFRKDGSAAVNEAKAAVVRRIYAQYNSGKSCCEIAKALGRDHIPAPGAGAHWNDVTVRRILTDSAYIGLLRLRTTRKTGYKCSKRERLAESEMILFPVPPILAPSEFRCAQIRIKQRGHAAPGRHPLSGKLICGICGRMMQVHTDRFRCTGRIAGHTCPNPSLRLDLLEHQLTHALHPYFCTDDYVLLSRTIQKITVYAAELHVQMHCRRPDSADDRINRANGETGLCKITK